MKKNSEVKVGDKDWARGRHVLAGSSNLVHKSMAPTKHPSLRFDIVLTIRFPYRFGLLELTNTRKTSLLFYFSILPNTNHQVYN